MISYLRKKGNTRCNLFWEANYKPPEEEEEEKEKEKREKPTSEGGERRERERERIKKPDYVSDLETRKRWLEMKYVEHEFCGVFKSEAIIKYKGKMGKYFLGLSTGRSDLILFSDTERLNSVILFFFFSFFLFFFFSFFLFFFFSFFLFFFFSFFLFFLFFFFSFFLFSFLSTGRSDLILFSDTERLNSVIIFSFFLLFLLFFVYWTL